MTTNLEVARALASRLPSYARVIALQAAHGHLSLILQQPDALTEERIRHDYQAAVGEGFVRAFGMSEVEAYSAEEFIDFYLRHGIVCSKLADALFKHLIDAAGHPGEGTLEETINRTVNEALDILSLTVPKNAPEA